MAATKKLYLVKEGKKVCGLCNGIGEYFDIDPTIIRLAWLGFVFIGGTGLLAYFIGALIVPTKPKDLYKEKGFESRLLSRSTEDSATVTSVLIPWNSCGMTQATVLKVPTLEYLPYCFYNIISPLMSILVAATGYKIYRTVKGPSASSEL